MNFHDFLSPLPRCQSFSLTSAAASLGLSYVNSGKPDFVAPTLIHRNDVPATPSPSIILISAAGAVGKSTYAHEIAFAKNAPIWDLAASAPVAANALDGMIRKGFGASASSAIDTALNNGELFFVIDALDEARLKVNEQSFEAFLNDFSTLAAATPVKFILLGRTQIIDTIWLILNEQNLPISFYSIAPFDATQRNEYIEKRVASIGGPGLDAMRAHIQPFNKARDILFDHLGTAISGETGNDDTAITNFLGYAPVLDSIAILLSTETNYSAIHSMIDDADKSATALLERILLSILSREQESKLAKNIRPLLQTIASSLSWSDWDSLYKPLEQIKRMLAIATGRQYIKEDLPPALSQRYEEQLQTWIPDHPFLLDGTKIANIVFEAYVFAHALVNDFGGYKISVERLFDNRNYKHSKLLADFYFHFNRTESPIIPLRHLEILYSSFLSGNTNQHRTSLALEGNEPDEITEWPSMLEGTFQTLNASDSTSLRERTFRIQVSNNSILHFNYIQEAAITVPTDIQLGLMGSEVEIGPEVYIRCRNLTIPAEIVILGRRPGQVMDGNDSVILEADVFSGSYSKSPQVRGTFHISWPGGDGFPWTPYFFQRNANLPTEAMRLVYRRFRRIALAFRSHSRGTLARLKHKIEHQRVLQGPVGANLLQKLCDDGILILRASTHYFWMSDTADRLLGISYNQLRQGETSPGLTQYIESFIRDNEELFEDS